MHGATHIGIREFSLVAVGDEIEPELVNKAARLADDLSTLVGYLADGKYWTRSADGTEVVTGLDHPERFARVVTGLGWGSLQITRVGIVEAELGGFLAKEAAAGASFDVTSCKNSLVAGVSAFLVARGGSPIYTFELRKHPTYGQQDLLPDLMPSEYVYRDLTSAPLLLAAIKKVNAFSLTKKKFLGVSVVLAIMFGAGTLVLPQTAVLSVLTGLASFASIISAMSFFLRE